LSDGVPRSFREIVRLTGLGERVVEGALSRLWRSGLVLRSEVPFRERSRVFRGRAGVSSTTRSYYLYVIRPGDVDSLRIDGVLFVKYDEGRFRRRGKSKARIILDFLREHSDQAFYSSQLARLLKDQGVKPSDIMVNVRRFERKGLVYVRGYRTHDRQTPFKEGYLITWIDQEKPREKALEEAVEKTNRVLSQRASTNPVIERVHMIRDQIIEAAKLRDIVSFEFLQNKLGCSLYEAETAINRALQLYPDIKTIKLFNNYRYYYHASMPEEDLKAAIKMKENYIRKVKSRENRIGHNWEAAAEFFIDTLTTGAKFWTQKHRTKGMDPRRITIHLIKPVAGRRSNAEVDRVWEVTPGPLLKPTIYVLECKWGLIKKENVDQFFEILRWSKEFGVDTPDGRKVKQGVIGVFAGSSFNPKEKVKLKDETEISLPTYAARMNIQLLKASDCNKKLRERGVPKSVTVQKICRKAKNEKEVREILETIWNNPKKSEEIIAKTMKRNKDLYEFEKMLKNN